MSRQAFERACGLLPDLDSAELEQLGARIAALRTFFTSPARRPPLGRAGLAVSPDAAFEVLLYEACSHALMSEIGEAPEPWGLFLLRRRTSDAFRKSAARAAQQHAQWFPKATRVETAALVRLYVVCSINRLRAIGLPVNWATFSSMLGRLAEIIGEAFPGYARSGLLSMIKARATSRKEEG